MVYGRYNYSIHGLYKPTNITGGHHPVVLDIFPASFLVRKVPETMRFWALISFTGGYAMNLVDPADNGEPKSSLWVTPLVGQVSDWVRLKRWDTFIFWGSMYIYIISYIYIINSFFFLNII